MKQNIVKINESKLKQIVTESVKRVLKEYMDNSFSHDEIVKLVSILKQNPITEMWKPCNLGFCMVQRIEANHMSGKNYLISQNEDGTDNLYEKEHNGIVLIQIGRTPNTHWLEESGSTYMVWKEK